MAREIYLDHNATTPVHPRVVEAVRDCLAGTFGNPSSQHRFGESAARALASARAEVARLMGARAEEIVFTSGGTESINTALAAAVAHGSTRGRDRILTSSVEHPAVSAPLAVHAARSCEVTRLEVDDRGELDVEEGARHLERSGRSFSLVTLQLANNETGVVTPGSEIERIGSAAREQGALFHLDAVQVPGKLPLDVGSLPVDLVSISAHKFRGPKGVGALFVREGSLPEFPALILGGPQELERRGGTPNVPGIVGMGVAAELARADVEAHSRLPEGDPVAALRDRLERSLLERIPGARVHGAGAPRLPNTSSLHLPGVPEDLLVQALAAEGVAVSSGAACSSSRRAPSPVLLAMGVPEDEARSTIRISLGRGTSREELDEAVETIHAIHRDLAL